MSKLAAIIPSRDERFLIPTVEDLFLHAKGEFEVIVVLDSDKWPDNWADVTAKYPNLHTVHNGKSLGMRASINRGVASAVSRRAKFIMKTDAHCSFSEGFDEVLKAECEPNWVVIPRRGRLDPEAWTATDTHKPDIDYHYLSFPDDPNDFGGPGLNGKVWAERAVERKDVLLDEEMSSQGSCWFMHAKYFNELELMDEEHYGTFWNEMQEILLKCWLSGGQGMINKKAKYLHLHKGRKYGRGYHLQESALQQGRTYTMKWLFNEAWPKQTLPFKTLIERFWPVPTWPEDWEERIYIDKVSIPVTGKPMDIESRPDDVSYPRLPSQLQIHFAAYGIGGHPANDIDVTDRVIELVRDGSLDITVDNATLTPGQNPFRGKKKRLVMKYSYDGGEGITIERQEKEWLIIGPVQRVSKIDSVLKAIKGTVFDPRAKSVLVDTDGSAVVTLSGDLPKQPPTTAAALNDYLIRKFHVSDRRLRAPMPVELRDFNRNDLAKLFAELGFTRGAEIGVAEGHYSEVLVKANPDLELLCVDPWHAYSANPQNKSKEKHEFAYSEAKRRLDGTKARLITQTSIDAVCDVDDGSLDFVYIDGNHSFDFCMFDLIAWSKKVRSGGIVSGDDYYHLSDRWGAGPVEAVKAYTNAHKISLWFICNAHKSVDFFWVKP